MYRSSFPSRPPNVYRPRRPRRPPRRRCWMTVDREGKSGLRSSIEEDSVDTIRTPGGPGSILRFDWSGTNNPTNRLIRDVFITLTTRRRTNWRTGRSKGTRHAAATNESDCSPWIELLMNYISLPSPSPPSWGGPPSIDIHLCRR